MEIRPVLPEEYSRVLELYAWAREFMKSTGNPQWGDRNPPPESVWEDITLRRSYGVVAQDTLVGVFALIPDGEPTYREILGAWHEDRPYGTIHRVAALPGYGAAHAIFSFAARRFPYLRIDTHRQNGPMRHRLEVEGFRYCGIIHLLNGEERLAYDRLSEDTPLTEQNAI